MSDEPPPMPRCAGWGFHMDLAMGSARFMEWRIADDPQPHQWALLNAQWAAVVMPLLRWLLEDPHG